VPEPPAAHYFIDRKVETALALARAPAGSRVLEVGCSFGHMTFLLTPRFREVTAIDLSGIGALQNVTNTVTFRIVNYGGASGGTWYIYDVANSTAADLAVQGIVASLTPPAPAVLSAPLFK